MEEFQLPQIQPGAVDRQAIDHRCRHQDLTVEDPMQPAATLVTLLQDQRVMLGLALRPPRHHLVLGIADQTAILHPVEAVDDFGAVDPFELRNIVCGKGTQVQHEAGS